MFDCDIPSTITVDRRIEVIIYTRIDVVIPFHYIRCIPSVFVDIAVLAYRQWIYLYTIVSVIVGVVEQVYLGITIRV